jgi:hypothetical protein
MGSSANKDSATDRWFDGLVNLFVQFGKLPKATPTSTFVNTALFAKAQQGL